MTEKTQLDQAIESALVTGTGVLLDGRHIPTQELYQDLELWDADPTCDHDEQAQPGGGVKCTKCGGWFCF